MAFPGQGHLPAPGLVFLPKRAPELRGPAQAEDRGEVLQAAAGGHVLQDRAASCQVSEQTPFPE